MRLSEWVGFMQGDPAPATFSATRGRRRSGFSRFIAYRVSVQHSVTTHRAARLVGAAGSGALLVLAFPSYDLWWLAPVAVAGLSLAVWGSRPRWALLSGFVFGLVFFSWSLSWSGTYVGKLPWFALATMESLYLAVMAGVTAWLQGRLLDRGRRFLAYAVVPLAWVAQEWLRSTEPYGGFPWVRLAFSQAESPLARFAAYGGAPGVTLLVATVGVCLAAAVLALRDRRRLRALGGLVAVGAVLGLTALIPLPTSGAKVTVALIQGNVPQAGLEFNAQRRAVLDNHVKGTLLLAQHRPADLSLVVWPENSSDIDPLRNEDANVEIRAAVAAIRAPILLGAVLDQPWPKLTNASLFYRTPTSQPEMYAKQHPVPFAEYIPNRSFYRIFSKQVDLVPHDFTAGHRRGAFLVDSSEGSYWALPTICFEVAYDGLMRDAVTHTTSHPSLLVVQTNNATFGYTDESTQQFAISRIRAIEHGRAVAHVSTVGVSGFVNPDGSTGRISTLFTADQMVGHPVVRSGLTVADRIGPTQDILPTALLLLLAASVLRRPRRASVGVPSTIDPVKEAVS